MTHKFWTGKRIFVTGHTGFKGSWLCLWLRRLGAHVTGYSLAPPTNPSLFEIARIGDGMSSIIADIRNFDDLRNAVVQSRSEVIFHLAAQPLVRYSYSNPRETYETNVMGTVNLLECIRQVGGVRAVVVVTSDKCYENREWLWGYRENEPMGGYDPYSSSKGCTELVTAAFRTSYFNPEDYSRHGVAIASARAGNVIGGGDWAEDRLVPDTFRAIYSGRVLKIRNPKAIRPWQHVLEPLSGYLLLAERLFHHGAAFSSAWNFGPSDEEARSVASLAEELARLWGAGAGWEIELGSSPHETTYLKLDSTKSRTLLGWRSRMGLSIALQSVVDWHKAHRNGEDMCSFTSGQIESYIKLQSAS